MKMVNKDNLNYFFHTCIRNLSTCTKGYEDSVGEFKEGKNYVRFDTINGAFFQAENGLFYQVPVHIHEEHFLNSSESEIQGINEEENIVCEWCKDEYESCELFKTDLGHLCITCIRAIQSRGEDITVFN